MTAAMTEATAGTLVFSTNAISFGSVMVGQTASASVTMNNEGTDPVQISGVQVTGQFFFVMGQGDLPITIAGGSTSTVNVQFAPGAAGMATGTLTVLSNAAGEGTTTIALSGNGEATSSIALSGLSCASGTVTGAGTDACTVMLTGAAGAGGLVVSLSSSSSAVTVPASVTVPAGASSVGFTATTSAVTTLQTAMLTAMAGTVTESYALQLSPSSSTATLSGLSCSSGTVAGAGTDACTVTLAGAAGAGGLAVNLSSGSSAVMVPASVTVPAGASSAGFAVTASAVTTTQTVTLTATAGGISESYALQLSASGPALTLQSTSVSFGDVTLNTPSTQAVLMTSSGTVPLTIGAGSVTGTGFRISGISFPVTLNPSQTATLYIEFDPMVTGAATGMVTLTDNTSAGEATIALKGNGQAVSYEVDLTWDAPRSSSDPVAGYDIYRAVSGSSSYQLLNSTIDVSTTYTDTTVVDGMAYQYYATSVDASGNQSAPSNIFSVTIP